MADREGGGMGAVLAMILGVLLVAGLALYFLGNCKKTPQKPKSDVPALSLSTPV